MQALVALAESQTFDLHHLPEDFLEDIKANSRAVAELEEPDIVDYPNSRHSATINVFQLNNGNISRTAKARGISRNTLYKQLKTLGIRE